MRSTNSSLPMLTRPAKNGRRLASAGPAGLCLLLGACAQGPARPADDATFFPALPQTPRVQYLTSINSEEDVGPRQQSRFRDFVVGPSEANHQLGLLRSVAHEPGAIYVLDGSVSKVIRIDLESGKFEMINDPQAGRQRTPASVFVAPDGYKYVADADRGEVIAYNERNEYSMSYSAPKPFRPTDAVLYRDRLYVCDWGSSEIVVFDRATGEILQTFGGIGAEEGMLRRPSHLDVDDAGNLFVTDAFNFRVQVFDANGTFVKTIGRHVAGPGGFARPKGLGIDRSGHLYVTDAAMELVQIFDVESARPLLMFGKRGRGKGSTYMPSDIVVDYDNVAYFNEYAHPDFKLEYVLYQANQLGNKLNVYGFGHWSGKSSPVPRRRDSADSDPKPAATPQTMPSLDAITESPDYAPPEEPGQGRD